MTDPVVVLEPTRLTVEPGGQARATITIKNPGTIVEDFRIDVVDEGGAGGPAVWARATPDRVQVYPDQSATAIITFAPPPGRSAPSGSFAFAARVRSTLVQATSDSLTASTAVEGDIEVGKVVGLQAKLTPVTSWGRWRGKHTVELKNFGNAPARLRLVAGDPDERLGFLVRPALLDLPVAGSALSRVKVRTRHPFLRGVPARLPFQIVAEPEDGEPVPEGPPLPGNPRRPVIDGAFMQKPILSRASVALAGIATVALAAGLVAALKGGPKSQVQLQGTAPAAPQSLRATAISETAIQLKWASIANSPGYSLVYLDPTNLSITGSKPYGGDVQQIDVDGLTAGTKYCFALKVVRDKAVSAASNTACASTKPAAPPPVTGSPTFTGNPGQNPLVTGEWLAMIGPVHSYTSGCKGAFCILSAAQAQAVSQQLYAQGINAAYLETANFPNLPQSAGFAKLPPFIVYERGDKGPWQSAADARAGCTKDREQLQTIFNDPELVCLPIQPMP